jgi:hypothetical protein
VSLPNINFTGVYPGPGLWSVMDVYRRAGAFLPTQATGGTITEITVAGLLYRVHTFTTVGSSSFEVEYVSELSPTVEYLVVAGGGGAGSDAGGGGGAGGYRCSVAGEMSGGGVSAEAPLTLSVQTYTVAVGAGGNPNTGNESPNLATNGGNSSFGSIVSTGGGYAGSWDQSAGAPQDGGSGGGNGWPTSGRGNGTASQGFRGGLGSGSSANGNTCGGGGGAGQEGFNGAFNNAGNGGNGVESNITGTPTYRAGGGGAGYIQSSTTKGIGGLGGGGNGATGGSGSAGTAGQANTGGGGGGGVENDGNGGAGGSGIVIIRYPIGIAS